MVNRPGERAGPLFGTCCLLILRDCPWTQSQDDNGEPENAPVDLVLSRHSHDSPRGRAFGQVYKVEMAMTTL
jgi:hypothetical protein